MIRWGNYRAVLTFLGLIGLISFIAPVSRAANCSNPAAIEGTIVYNSSESVLQYCNGANWQALGAVDATSLGGGGGNTCATPPAIKGTILYNSTHNVPQYCSGDTWIALSDPHSGGYVPNAVNFDGNTWLTRGAGLTGAADDKRISASFWFRTDTNSSSGYILFASSSSGGDAGSLQLFYRASPDDMDISAWNPAGTQVLHMDTVNGTLADTNWHHILLSVDLNDGANKHHFYIDDVDQVGGSPNFVNDVMDLTYSDYLIGNDSGGTDHEGDLVDLWIDMGTYIDFSVEANRRKFISASLCPVYLGDNGSLPTGTSPEIFLSGDVSAWHTNKGTGGGFTENGTLIDAASDPGSCGGGGPTGGSCTNPTANEGVILYNDDYNIHQYCDGSNWIRFSLATDMGITVNRVQYKINQGNPSVATFDTTPVPGSLLVAIAGHRNASGDNSISGTGWTQHVNICSNCADSNNRRGLAIWSKIAGASEPTAITADLGAGNSRLIIQEFTVNGGTFAFDVKAETVGGTADVTSLSSGTTALSATDHSLVVTGMSLRSNPNALPGWNNGIGDVIGVDEATTNYPTMSTGFRHDTTASTKESTTSFTPAGDPTTAVAVFKITPD